MVPVYVWIEYMCTFCLGHSQETHACAHVPHSAYLTMRLAPRAHPDCEHAMQHFDALQLGLAPT